ncbi:hypothetical protein [Candidatus Palauibacter sp.]|uniref:hypothetical protein n=1 Tax=Candidatus Palauibacter sp. TaxID=3101350 RepID=UPI003C6F16C2
MLGTVAEEARLALITTGGPEGPTIILPAEVRAGEPFNVRVLTYFCNREQVRTEVVMRGTVATVKPYNRIVRNGKDCGPYNVAEHVASVRFRRAALAHVIVVGMGVDGDTVRAVRRVVVR